MRVIIAGSRSFTDTDVVDTALHQLFLGDFARELTEEVDVILSGSARGADQCGEDVAQRCGIPVERYPAEWDKYGKTAGVIRNQTMAENADALVAFWDGKSKGTRHMIETALNVGLEVHVYRF